MRNDWKDPSVPEWVSFFSREEYEEFIILVGKYFTEKKVTFTIEEGVVNVEGSGSGFGKMGLDNIARTCKQSPMNEWESRIYGHFDALEKSRKFQEVIQTSKKSFDEMKKYIAVRLYNSSYLEQIGEEHFIFRRLANDLIAALVFDYPDSIQNMQNSDTEGWNKSHDDLFDIAIDNVRSNYSLLLNKNEMEDYIIYTLDSDHFFAGNLYFELDQLPTIDASKGALVAFPHRHCSVMYPIKDISMVKVLNQLFPIVFNMNNDGAGPITNSIYWYHKGKLMAIPYELDKEGLKVIPPAEFVEFMNTLAGK